MTVAALLLAGLAATVNTARAQNPGDLILGFQASAGTGAATNVEIDLGAASNYEVAGAGTYNIANLISDLTSTYGSWTSDSNLSFAIVGSNTYTGTDASGPKRSMWLSGVVGSPYTTSGSTTYASANSAIGGIYGTGTGAFGDTANTTNLSDINNTTATIGSNSVTLLALTSAVANQESFTGAGSSLLWDIPNATSSAFVGANVGSGSANAELFYYKATLASGVNTPDVNSVTGNSYFTLASNGELSFTVVPEPSTYAALIGVAALGYSLLRRRKVIA